VSVGNAAYIAIVINADIQSAALRVGKAANPFQIFVAPSFLIFSILVFVVHISDFHIVNKYAKVNKKIVFIAPFSKNYFAVSADSINFAVEILIT